MSPSQAAEAELASQHIPEHTAEAFLAEWASAVDGEDAQLTCHSNATSAVLLVPPPASPASWAWRAAHVAEHVQRSSWQCSSALAGAEPAGHLAALSTRDEPPSRPGPSGRLWCGRAAQPESSIPRRSTSRSLVWAVSKYASKCISE